MNGIFSALVTVFGIMFLGLFVERRRILAPTMALCLNQFVYWVSLPAMLFDQMCSLPPSGSAGAYIWATLGASLIAYAAAWLYFSRRKNAGRAETTIRPLASVFPNAGFFGLPFVFMVFPGNETASAAAMLGALLYSGVLLIADATLDLSQGSDGKKRGTLQLIIGELIHNPMLVAAAVGIAAGVSGFRPPEAVMNIASMLGSTAAPCALFGMGMVLSAQLAGSHSGRGTFSRRNLAAVCAAKVLIQPAITYLVLLLAGCSGMMLAVGVIMAAMPTGTLVYTLGERYQACPTEASMTVIVTTLLSLVSLPLVMYALQLAGAV